MNPGRTGRRVINVDINKEEKTLENFEIKGELPTLFTELEFTIADIYLIMLSKGFNVQDASQFLDKIVKNGCDSAWKVIKESKNI